MQKYKRTSALFVIAAFFFSLSNSLFAQQKTVTIEPEKPEPAETITITYHPEASGAKITSPDSLKLVWSFKYYLYHLPDKIEMKKTDEGWQTELELSERFGFGSFYFKSGEKTDKNKEGHHFTFMAYKNGAPVKNAYLLKINSLSERYNKDSAKTVLNDLKAVLFSRALAVHPNNYEAKTKWFGFLLSQKYVDSTAVKDKAFRFLDKKLAVNPRSRSWVTKIEMGYNRVGEEAMGDSVEQAMIDKYPKSDIGWYDFYQSAQDEKNKDKQTEMLLEYIKADYNRSWLNKYYTESAYKTLFEYYAEKGDIEKMKQFAALWLKPNPKTPNQLIRSEDYNEAAEIITKNTEAYDWAMRYARKALRITDEEPANTITTKFGEKVYYIEEDRRKEIINERKSEILATIGFIYTKQNKVQKAEVTLTKAKELSDDNSARIYMANLYRQTNRPKQAFDIYWELLLEEPMNEEFQNRLKESYIAYNGSAEGFEQKTEELDAAWREKMIAKFKVKMMDKEPPSLAHVTDLQGNQLDLSTLKNKVVVIDFWATWCGPCLSAFPYLQNVYEEYQDNSNVKFIVLNSAWSNTIKDARKWKKEGEYAEKNYSFPLYYDKNSKVTTAFGVRGIPTTFILGKDGDIKFKHIGYPGPGLEKKLTLRIEMVLNGTAAEVNKTSTK